MPGEYRVAVIGATGAVGTVMVNLLGERALPVRELTLFASERSTGKFVGSRTVCSLNEESIAGFDIALFSAGSSVSKEWAPRFVAAGATVIDNSSCWRMDDGVPLVVSEVNPDAIDHHHGIIANPNCSAMQMLVALKPLYDAVGIERISVTTYQATSGTGQAAIDELVSQTHSLLNGKELTPPSVYQHQIGFNVLPQAGVFADGDDHTDEERKIMDETRKILEDDEIRVSATCARVPVINGHSQAVNIETATPLEPGDAREILRSSAGVTVIDDPANAKYPLAINASGHDDVFVGRIRKDPSHDRGLSLWIVADNLRKGAATNAIQIAELLHERQLARL